MPHFLGKNAKRDPHKLFQGDFGFKKGVPNGLSWATMSLVFVFLPEHDVTDRHVLIIKSRAYTLWIIQIQCSQNGAFYEIIEAPGFEFL